MATFLKTTEISIDGARTLPREYYTSPEIFGDELEHIFTEALALRRARGPAPQPGRLVRPGDRQGERHRPAGTARAGTGRTTTSAAIGAPGSARSTPAGSRDDPVSLPRLDLRARRPAHRRALHQRDRELRQGRLAALHRWRVATWEGFLFINLAEEPEPFDAGLGAAAGPVQPVQPAEPQGGPHHRVRREGRTGSCCSRTTPSATTAARCTRRWPSSPRPPAARTTSPRARSPAASWCSTAAPRA